MVTATKEGDVRRQPFRGGAKRPAGAEQAHDGDGSPTGPSAGGQTAGSSDRQPDRSGGWRGLLQQFGWQWVWVLIGLLAINWLSALIFLPSPAQQRITVPFTVFKEQVQAGNVSQVSSQGDQL
ncbi:MAG TPA: hypothetical protein VHN78_11985 [Chloroflexota bacterium]|nr:hypothetical protein [Chloroflexota bacterium]